MIDSCAKKNIAVKASVSKPYSSDENALHISYEAGKLKELTTNGIELVEFGMCVTLMAAAGYAVHTFPTGQGNVIGNPIVPVIKISGNPRTIRTMSEHIDVDVSGVLRREMTLEEAGDSLIEMVVRTANGRLTAAEALGHREFSLTKLYRSA